MKVLSLLLGLCAIWSLLKVNFAHVYVGEVVCRFNPLVTAHGYCNVSSRVKMKYLNAGVELKRTLTQIRMHLRLLRKINGKYKEYRVNINQNLCDLTELNVSNYFINRVIGLFAQKIKNLKCPWSGNVAFSKVPIMMHLSEGLFPPSEYILNDVVYAGNIEVVDFNVSFVINAKQYN